MNLSIQEQDRKRKTEQRARLSLASIALLQSVICTPLHHLFNSNVSFRATVLPQLWDTVQYFVSFAFYWCAFAFLIYVAARYTLRSTVQIMIYYFAFSSARYILSLLVGSLMLLQFPILDDLWQFLFELLIDAVQIAAVALTAHLLFEKGRTDRVRISLHKFFSASDLFLRGMMITALIPTAVRILSRIRYDIYVGLPQGGADLLGMIFWYALDIGCALIGYLVMYWIVSKLLLVDLVAEKENP